MRGKTKVIMLGSGSPDPDPGRSGPVVAIVSGGQAYLVDCGANVIRQSNRMNQAGIPELRPGNLRHLFLTHLHFDHTLGYADFLLTPWITGRTEPMEVFGPEGTLSMTEHLIKAYDSDVQERLQGVLHINSSGMTPQVTEIHENGTIYTDQNIKVDAFRVKHGDYAITYAYRFTTADKVIVVSGDKCPTKGFEEFIRNCDILLHEAYPTKNLENRPEKWKLYHGALHTSSYDLGLLARSGQVGKVVLYHPIYLLGNRSEQIEDLNSVLRNLEDYMVKQIQENFDGEVVMSQDFDIYQ